MSRFKRIKNTSTKKSSVSIDEKIAALNKELKKTGMISEMDTSNVYQTTSSEPNPTHIAFNTASFNSLGLGHSGSDGHGSGGAYTGKVVAGEHGLQSPAHDSILNLDGVAVSPPHPVSGQRVYASTRLGGMIGQQYFPTQPGKIQGNRELPTGSVMWIWNPNTNNSDGTTGQWYPLEFEPFHGKWGFWDTNFMGFGFLNLNLDQLEFTPGDSTGATLLALINSLGIFNTNNIGSPKTNVLKQDPLGDPSFLPIDIMKTIAGAALGAAKEAFEFFKSKAKSTPKPAKPEKKYEKNRKKNRPEVKGGGEAEELLKSALATGGDFLDNPIKYAVQGLLNLGGMIPGYNATATSFNNLVHHTNNNNPNHPNFRKNDPSSDNYEGPAEVQTSDANRKNIVNALNISLSNLNGGKGPTNPNGNLTNAEIKKLSDDMKNNYKNNKTNQAYNTFYNSFHSLPTGGDRGDGKPVTTVTVKDGKFEKLDSNYWFTDPVDANPLLSDKSTGLSAKNLPSTIISNTIHGVTQQATKNGKWTEGSDGEPFYSDENKTKIIGTQYNTQQSFSAKPPKSNNTIKDYEKNKNKNKNKNNFVESLDESVGLGYFDPEELNVDIEDIRKGVMPEYPKKAPPEMIDGYSATSKLAPRVVKGEPTIKITKKDLTKFHKLKKSEIDEFMNDVNQINDYLQKNPADLIYAQQRYPKDDPRLAALNWKMDQIIDASNEYMDSNFKVNQTLFKRATERTKRNTALTNPDYIQKHYDELRGTIKTEPKPTINRKSPSRFFKKEKKKSSMEAINDKIKQLDKDLLL